MGFLCRSHPSASDQTRKVRLSPAVQQEVPDGTGDDPGAHSCLRSLVAIQVPDVVALPLQDVEVPAQLPRSPQPLVDVQQVVSVEVVEVGQGLFPAESDGHLVPDPRARDYDRPVPPAPDAGAQVGLFEDQEVIVLVFLFTKRMSYL